MWQTLEFVTIAMIVVRTREEKSAEYNLRAGEVHVALHNFVRAVPLTVEHDGGEILRGNWTCIRCSKFEVPKM